MDLGVKGKKAFVSGSTKGIGFATALELAGEGAEVWMNGRSEDGVHDAVNRLRDKLPSAEVRGLAADLATADGCRMVIEALPELDILVNNVGIFEPKSFGEIPDEDWFRLFETNVMSGVRLSRHYLAGMKTRNWGRVIFVSSESAIQIPEEMIHYGMTKTAQVAISRGMAETTRGTGVTVNSVLPGPCRSEGVERFVGLIAEQRGMTFEEMEREFFEKIRPSSLLQRFATPDEVAHIIVFLCGKGASATNGAAIRVDGGVVKAAL